MVSTINFPKASSGGHQVVRTDASDLVTGFLTEYTECMESYRHTYTTIWAAGVFFLAISGGLVSLLDATAGAWWVAALPLLTWWWVVFEPLQGFAVKRRNRLREIEKKLPNLVPGLEIKHIHLCYGADEEHDEKIWRAFLFNDFIKKPRMAQRIRLLAFATIVWTFVYGSGLGWYLWMDTTRIVGNS